VAEFGGRHDAGPPYHAVEAVPVFCRRVAARLT
jgi:hypothetical protein